jgi:hypothetical protein
MSSEPVDVRVRRAAAKAVVDAIDADIRRRMASKDEPDERELIESWYNLVEETLEKFL